MEKTARLVEQKSVNNEAGKPRKSVQLREAAAEKKQAAIEKSRETVVFLGREMPRADLFRIAGLIGFFIILALVTVAVLPMITTLLNEGPEELAREIRSAGPLGMLMLLGLQFAQILIVFIPGEAVQLAAGMMYGPWLGAAIILIGCLASSAVIYQLVHRLGQPFVEDVVSTKYLDKLREFEKSGKLNTIVFILFLIPGLPKDVFTYLVPLTNMPMKTYLTIITIARFPGVIMSTYAASGFLDGNIKSSIIMLVVLAVIAGVALLFKDKLLALVQGNNTKAGTSNTRSSSSSSTDGDNS